MFGPLFHWHQKSSQKRSSLEEYPDPSRTAGEKKNAFSVKGHWKFGWSMKMHCWYFWRLLSTWLEKGVMSQPHWVRGFLRTSRRIHTYDIYTWCTVYSIEEYVFEKEANTQSVSKDLPMTNPQHFRSSSNWSRPQIFESPHGLWCWTTSSEHPWKQLHVVGVMHCPDIKPENSGEDQFKGKSWVPLGEYLRYKATKKKTINMGLYHACIGYTVPSGTQNVPLINRLLLSFLMSICDWEGRSPT